MKIVLFGATGNVGKVLMKEILTKETDVTVVVRSKDKLENSNVKIVEGDIKDYGKFLKDIPKDAIVISAMGPVFGNENDFSEIMSNLIEFSKEVKAQRIIVVGGAGSLYVAEGLKLVDTESFPKDWKPIASAHINALEQLKESNLNWTYFSPAAFFEPGEKKGNYKLGNSNLISDENGNSKISFADYSEALVNEIAANKYEKKQMTIGY